MMREAGARAARQARRKGECRLDFLPFVLSLLCRLFCRPSESPSCVNAHNTGGRGTGGSKCTKNDKDGGGSMRVKAGASKR